MPLPLMLALFVAFGVDVASPAPRDAPGWVVGQVAIGVAVVGLFAALVGRAIERSAARVGRASSRIRRAHAVGVRVVDLLGLLVFGAIIHDLGWPGFVRDVLGLRGVVLADEALILAPFLAILVVGWWGLYPAERALRPSRPQPGLGRYLVLKARQTMGMVLPVAAAYSLGTALLHRLWPGAQASPWEQPITLGLMGLVVLALAPALVRVAWPTAPLPPGPLRDRLEQLARRVGFRCTDILVWDTNRGVVNAGVTGALPWYRYVLLTDALIDHLSPHEVAAVFGHEVGHIAHRHLLYFGFFILGSLGLLALGEMTLGTIPMPDWVAAVSPNAPAIAQTVLALAIVGAYFLVVFGHLSRRFERQADVFGCRVVSCGLTDCPPHLDRDGRPAPAGLAGARPPQSRPERQTARRQTDATPLCPVGIRIFVSALSNVAMLNGMQPRKWSWRHGSILRRIEFLEGLIERPEAERRFQSGVRRLRYATALMLAAAIGAVLANGYWR